MNENEKDKEKTTKRASLAIFIIVLLLFLGVMFITYFFEVMFSKTAGTVALVVIAIVIAFYLYRKEIMTKLRRK